MDNRLHLRHLAGGGIVLGYRCQSYCRHCLYGSGAHRRDGKPTEKKLTQLLDLLANRAPNARFHIGGGEPFLDLPLLLKAISEMKKRHLYLEYVETNAGWVKSQPHAEETLGALSAAGLDCLLVSLSPFHAEHVPLKKVRILSRAASKILRQGAFVWMPTFETDLSPEDENSKLDLERFLRDRGAGYALRLAERYGLVPGGRTARYLCQHGNGRPLEDVILHPPCIDRLRDTTHFHVDGDGLYVPGLCAGLVLPLKHLPGAIDLTPYPVIRTLLEPDGLSYLVKEAAAMGFEPLAAYSSPCDVCNHVRFFLFQRRPTPDLGPRGYYQSKSVPGYPVTLPQDSPEP